MDIKLIAVCFAGAALAGFIHGSLGMGFGMIAMATTTLFIPYNNAAAIVSVALLVLVVQMTLQLRKYIYLREVIVPSLALTAGKMLGIILMMNLNSGILRIALGLFLIAYAASQFLQIKALRIRGSPIEGVIFCGLGGFFGGMFNVSGPFTAIYCQARYDDDPKCYAANMNFIFAPSAVAAVVMHFIYGNFNSNAVAGSISMVAALLVSTAAGISVLKRINSKKMFTLSYIYIIIMGFFICIFG